MDLELETKKHAASHPSVWIPSGKTAKDGTVLWYHVPRGSEEHEEYLKTKLL